MSENTKIIISIFCIFFALFLIGAGLLMHKYDFSSMFRPAFVKTDGLYIRCGFKFKRIADDTPENRIKFSKLLGKYFIVFSALWLVIALIVIWH